MASEREEEQAAITSNRAADTIPGFGDMLDHLTKLLAEMPRTFVFASSILFPTDGAWQFSDERHDYLCAGPNFWAKVPEAIREPGGHPFVLGAIRIVDVDLPSQREMREKVFKALIAKLDGHHHDQ